MDDDTSAPLSLSAAGYLAATMPLQMACVRSMFHLGGLLADGESPLGWSEEQLAALDGLSTQVARISERWDRVEAPESLASAHAAFAGACRSYRAVIDRLYRAIDRRDPGHLAEARAQLNIDLVLKFKSAEEEQSRALGLTEGNVD